LFLKANPIGVYNFMLNYQTFSTQEMIDQEEDLAPSPELTVVEDGDKYGKITVEPLSKGAGITLGNPIRRVLYSSLSGSAITWVKIEGVSHEYTTIPNVKEEVSEFLLNVQGIKIRSEVDRPGKLRLEASGPGNICAGDLMAASGFEIINPDLHLASLDNDKSTLSVEFNVEYGTGYGQASRGEGLPIGVLPIDAVYTPIRKVNYSVDQIRVGKSPDFEKLTVEIWTDGSVNPVDAMKSAGTILVEQFFLFANTKPHTEDDVTTPLNISPQQYNTSVEKLDLSSRTLNCLKRTNIDKVGQILEMKKSDLLTIRNFGKKSLDELFDRLDEMGLLPDESDVETSQASEDDSGETLESADTPDTEAESGDES